MLISNEKQHARSGHKQTRYMAGIALISKAHMHTLQFKAGIRDKC